MKDSSRTNSELIKENSLLKQRIKELEQSESERKQVEEALQESENRLREITTQVPGVVYQFYVRPNGAMGFYYISDRSEMVIGLKPDLEGYFERFSAIVIPEHRDGFIKSIVKSVNESSEWKYEGMLQKPSGEIIWFSGNSVPSLREDKMVFNGIVRDITERKRAEKALHESEQRYRAVFENTGTATVIIEANTIISLCNSEFERLSGYTRNEIEGKKSWTEFVIREDLDCMIAQHRIRRENHDHALQKYEFRFVPLTGEIRNIYLVIDTIHGTEKSVGSLMDITARKQAEDELKQRRGRLEQLIEERTGQLRISENKYRTLFENANDAIFLMRQDVFIDCNTKALELFGYTKGRIIGETPYELSPPFQSDGSESRKKAMKKIDAAASGTPQCFEWQHIRNDGTVVDTEVNLHVVTIGEERILQALVHDITERKHAEETIKKAEEQYKSLVETVSEWIWEVDANGVCLYASPRIYNILGYKPEEVLGKTPFDFMPPEESKRVLPIFEKLVAEKKPILSLEGIHYHKDGHIVFHDTNGFPFFDKEGALLGYRGSDRDITEQKQIMAELQQNKNDLEAKSKTLEEVNTALRVLLHQREEDKKNLEDRVVSNVKKLVIPYIEKMKKNRLDPQQLSNLTILETNLNEIVSPFLHNIRQLNLSPRETQIASLVKDGKTTKEIAEIIGVATSAIDSYRNSIRTKLGLNNKKANLQSYLQSFI